MSEEVSEIGCGVLFLNDLAGEALELLADTVES